MNKINVLVVLVVVFAFVMATSVSAIGNTYYVSPLGNDSNNGSQSAPWATIQKAANSVVAGDTVNVRGGSYLEVITFDKSGTAASPITFQNYPGETPIIDGVNLPPGAITDLIGPLIMINGNYVVFSGFTVQNSPGQGIKNKGAYNKISHNKIHNMIREGLMDSNGHDTIYQDNEVSNSALRFANQNVSGGWPCAVGFYGSSNHNTYQNNYIHNNHGEGLCSASYNQLIGNTVKDNWSVDIYLDGVNNVTVSNNLIIESETAYVASRDIANGISIADEVNCAQSNNIITNNIIIGAKTGINYYQYQSCSGLKNTLVQNNTFVNIWNYGIRAIQGVNSGNIFKNNIFYAHLNTNRGENAQSILFELPNDSKFENNLFYSPGGSSTNQFNWSGNSYDFSGWQNLSTNIKNNVWADPLLKNAGQLDPIGAQLTTGSPAIDKGENTGVSVDYWGSPRPQGLTNDIGAYEYATTGSGNPTPTVTVAPTQTPSSTPVPLLGDLNNDRKVDIFDYNMMIADFGKSGIPGFIPADINKNGQVDVFDYNYVVMNFGRSY